MFLIKKEKIVENPENGDGSYVVVFEYLKNSSYHYPGIREKVIFQSKEDFEKILNTLSNFKKVIAEGVTKQEALALVNETLPEIYLLDALYLSTDSSGKVSIPALRNAMPHAFVSIKNSIHAAEEK